MPPYSQKLENMIAYKSFVLFIIKKNVTSVRNLQIIFINLRVTKYCLH